MRITLPLTLLALAGPALLAGCGGRRSAPTARAAAVSSARAELRDAAGGLVGLARLEQTPTGVLINAEFANLPVGTHGFHFHQSGSCSPSFEAAGGHFAPAGRRHGFRAAGGPHAGDLPNVHVTAAGPVRVELMAAGLTLGGGRDALLDADGAALIVHAQPDDYSTDPSGGSGERIACGVVTR